MKHNRFFTFSCAIIGILILILDSKTALLGASEGIELCLKTVIPSLFPFLVLSSVLTSYLPGSSVGFLRPFFRCLGVPPGAESLVLTGVIGGYPVGAQTIAQAYREKRITKASAQRLLAFCNNAGPSFLFGMVASQFPHRWMVWALWCIHLSGAIFAAIVIPSRDAYPVRPEEKQAANVNSAVTGSIRVMAVVCAWIILFRILIAFFDRWFLWLLPPSAQIALTGILELANGCCALGQIKNVNLRFVICSGILAFGGLCVTMQTVSVTGGLSLKHYFPGKLLQTAFSILASICVCTLPASGFWVIPIVLLIPMFSLTQIRKKHCIREKSIV